MTITAARSTADISSTAAPFIVSGYGGAPSGDAHDRTVEVIVDASGLGLAEVHVVDRREAAQQLAVGSRKGRDGPPTDLVLGVRAEIDETLDRGAVVGDDHVVGDGGDLDGHGARVTSTVEPA